MILKWGWRVEGGAMRILLAPWKASSKRGRWRRSSNRGPFLKPSYPHCHFQHWSYQSLCPQIVKSSTFPNPPKVKHVFTSHFYFANHQTDSCMASDQMSQNGEAAAALAVPCFLSNWGRDPGAICRLGLFGACPENNTNISCRRIWWQVFNILSNLGTDFRSFFTFPDPRKRLPLTRLSRRSRCCKWCTYCKWNEYYSIYIIYNIYVISNCLGCFDH